MGVSIIIVVVMSLRWIGVINACVSVKRGAFIWFGSEVGQDCAFDHNCEYKTEDDDKR